jgi:protease I
MDSKLDGLRIAILATDGFEQSELLEPRSALDSAGATTEVVSPKASEIRAWNHADWGKKVDVDLTLDQADADDFDALVLPGGVMSPDALRMNPAAVAFVKAFFVAGKPVAAICHGPWTVVESGEVSGYELASWPSLKTDITNAGGKWVDREVVVDDNLITSRRPDDIPAFNREMIAVFAQYQSGKREPRTPRAKTLQGLGQTRQD